jgi:hypothetical protein
MRIEQTRMSKQNSLVPPSLTQIYCVQICQFQNIRRNREFQYICPYNHTPPNYMWAVLLPTAARAIRNYPYLSSSESASYLKCLWISILTDCYDLAKRQQIEWSAQQYKNHKLQPAKLLCVPKSRNSRFESSQTSEGMLPKMTLTAIEEYIEE